MEKLIMKIQNNKKLQLIILLITELLLIGINVFCMSRMLIETEEQTINCTEDKTADYKVYLKDNDFYEQEFMPKDKIYIASIIKNISIDLEYTLTADKNLSNDFEYEIIGELNIESLKGANFLKKEYTLQENKNVKMDNTKRIDIKENINIDYDYYNRLTNSFRSSYAVETNSYLNVYLRIKKNKEKLNDLTVKIPLSEKAIEINIDTKSTTETIRLTKEENSKIDFKYLIIEIITGIIFVVILGRITRIIYRLLQSRNEFDVYINNILKTYDRLIAETTTPPVIRDRAIIKINKFEELLDVHDNLKLPIMYYVFVPHQKGTFYVTHNDEIFLFTIEKASLKGKINVKERK